MQPFPHIQARAPFIWHGGDYNPEQWPSAIWDTDMRLMQECHFNTATIGVFSWSALQPAEDHFSFEWLDSIIEKLSAAGRIICLATPSAAQPAWMSRQYPETLRVDERGRRRHQGWRVNYCPTSPDYRRLATRMARKLAERYHQQRALVAWHISNEYFGTCYCATCSVRFRGWLQQQYASLDDLNQKWWTAFWSHTYTDWEQIELPLAHGERSIPALLIDYRRFQSSMALECFISERDAIREYSADLPITTNMMNMYQDMDYRSWAREVDVISWDSYPGAASQPAEIALGHDFMRGLRDGQPFLLLEQTPSSSNWQEFNTLKRPGILRLWSYVALAHGAESVMYFQWRRGRGGFEKTHGAVIEHSGQSNTRVFQEVSQLGEELARLKDLTLGGVTISEVALLFDWNNWWALEATQGITRDKRYIASFTEHYSALWKQHIALDIVFSDSDFSRYRVLIAPLLYMLKPGVAERIAAFVQQGGIFLATYLSGMVDEHDLAFSNGYPGPLREILGIWNEEIDALPPERQNSIRMSDRSEEYQCGHICAIIHCEGAVALATYGHDFYAGTPVLTRNSVGKGAAYYLASEPEPRFLETFYGQLLQDLHIRPPLVVPEGIEVSERQTEHGAVLFLLNHTTAEITVDLPEHKSYIDHLRNREVARTITLASYDVAILKEK